MIQELRLVTGRSFDE